MFTCNKEWKQYCGIKIKGMLTHNRCVLWLRTNYVIPQEVSILIITLNECDKISLPITLCNLNTLIRQFHLWRVGRLYRNCNDLNCYTSCVTTLGLTTILSPNLYIMEKLFRMGFKVQWLVQCHTHTKNIWVNVSPVCHTWRHGGKNSEVLVQSNSITNNHWSTVKAYSLKLSH